MKNELVHSWKSEVYCDSRTIAEEFNKQHQHILRKIDQLRTELANLDHQNGTPKNDVIEIFKERTHFYRGQNFRFFDMNRPAFSLLVMGLTGKKALKKKRAFNSAFYLMEQALLRQGNLEWQREREQGKQIRLELTDEIKAFIDYAISQGSKNADKYLQEIKEGKKLRFIKDLGMKKLPNSEQKKRYWLMQCLSCGEEVECEANNVKRGIKSCKNCKAKKHGLGDTRLYRIHSAMKQRCYNSKNTHFKYYGEKGITICKEWKNDFVAFFMWAVENGYNDYKTIDRENNNGNYEPINCRWVTKNTQSQNTAKFCNNTSGFRGVSLHVSSGLWHAAIQGNNKRISLGYFNSPYEAGLKYDQYVLDNNLEHTLNILKRPRLQYKALKLIEKNEKIDKQFRNTLDIMDLHNLLSAEQVARKALIDGIEQKLHYKDIYQLAKQRVFQLADIMIIKPKLT